MGHRQGTEKISGQKEEPKGMGGEAWEDGRKVMNSEGGKWEGMEGCLDDP